MASITAKEVSKLCDVASHAQMKVLELERVRARLIAALNDVREWFDTGEIPVGPAEQALFEDMDKAVKYAEDHA